MANVMPYGAKERSQEGQLLVQIVGRVLEELVSTNASTLEGRGATAPGPDVTKFHGLRAPTISIAEYLLRISKFSGCSDPCFVLSLIYVDRLITRKKVVLDSLNVHRLIITSMLLAAKFFDDHYLDNTHYAAVGGIPGKELNTLEVEFSFLAEFHFHVSMSDYDTYYNALASKAQSLRPTGAALPPTPVTTVPATSSAQPAVTATSTATNPGSSSSSANPMLPYQQPQTQGHPVNGPVSSVGENHGRHDVQVSAQAYSQQQQYAHSTGVSKNYASPYPTATPGNRPAGVPEYPTQSPTPWHQQEQQQQPQLSHHQRHQMPPVQTTSHYVYYQDHHGGVTGKGGPNGM